MLRLPRGVYPEWAFFDRLRMSDDEGLAMADKRGILVPPG